MTESDFNGSTLNGAYTETAVSSFPYKLSQIVTAFREDHGGMCFGWEFVPQGKLSYILEAEHRAENIQRIGTMG
ncbi:hypothetical protein ACFXTH_002691 [Malus domestica]